MAQNLHPNRSDNRGGNKPVTSTKKLFIYRVERSKHEELKAYAIKLNQEAENEKYTVLYKVPGKDWIDLFFKLSLIEAEKEKELREKEYNAIPCQIPDVQFKIELLPCNTTEK